MQDNVNYSTQKLRINLFTLKNGSMAGYIGDKFVFSRSQQPATKKAHGQRLPSSRSRRSPVRSASKSGDDGGGEEEDSDPEPPKLKYHPLAALSERRRAA